jgi:L-arabinose isomerase
MTTNTDREMWEDLADIADIELALIDEDTTVRGFAKERLLETAIHRLNGGR